MRRGVRRRRELRGKDTMRKGCGDMGKLHERYLVPTVFCIR
nr:MAG TPA: hypothetical protein [Bacteriophage sp.]DAQ35561.1 MAG TPA: hypothetical protein [Caudoviricetes sp.]